MLDTRWDVFYPDEKLHKNMLGELLNPTGWDSDSFVFVQLHKPVVILLHSIKQAQSINWTSVADDLCNYIDAKGTVL